MNHKDAHNNATNVINAIYYAHEERPQASDGKPAWFYDLCARAALIVGDSPILFTSHNLTDSTHQDGQVWLFTQDAVVIAAVSGSDTHYELSVCAVGRKTLTGLRVNRVDDPFSEQPTWPARIEISLEFKSGDVVTLPLARDSNQRRELAELVPSLARELS